MYSEDGILVDFDEVSRLIEDADVFAVGFAGFSERLLVDARSNDRETPLVRVVEPKGSAQERVAWLMRRRPSLGKPGAFSFVGWPHSPALLVESGIWEQIRKRVGAGVDERVDARCSLALQQLQRLNREAIIGLLKGEQCITLWPPEEPA